MTAPLHRPLSSYTARAPGRLLGRLGVIASAALLASACTVLQEDRIDYKSAQRGNALEVPPDLTQLNRESRYVVPGSSVTASGQQAQQAAAAGATSATAASAVGDVRIERAGSQRWLVVDRPVESLWLPVNDFWKEMGFELTLSQEKLGILETDWAENRAKLPQDFIRSTIGRVFENLYSTGERDKFRTRLERNASGGTDIFISHRGMIEVYTSNLKDQTAWQPRATDPELETEFLRRLMVKLGVSQAQAEAVAATTPAAAPLRVETVDGTPVVRLQDDFDRAWRRVGLALDRNSFTVEDRDRSQGLYFVRYVPTTAADAQKPGLLGRLFGSRPAAARPEQYRVRVLSEGAVSTVSVLNATGQAETSDTAQRILGVIAQDLN